MNENTEARQLLERALGTEPALGLDADKVLAHARREAGYRRSTMLGGAAVGVAAVAVAAVFITTHRSPADIGPATPPSPANCGPSVSPSEPPSTTLSSRPPTTTHLSPTAPTAAVSGPPTIAGMCVADGAADWPTDGLTERLTTALANANVIPSGMQALPAPEARAQAMVFARTGAKAVPAMTALLRDDRGWGRLYLMVGDSGQDRLDPKPCAQYPHPVQSCAERTMPDGGQAQVTVEAGPVSVPGSAMLLLTVVRPNGSYLRGWVNNAGELGTSNGHAPAPTRPSPPLGVEDMFRIGAIAGLTL